MNTSTRFGQHIYDLHGIRCCAASVPSWIQPRFHGVRRASDPGAAKGSVRGAARMGSIRTHLDRLLRTAILVAKKVRTETQIGSSSVSIASVAVDLAKKIFGSLEGKRVMLVGNAGKMGEVATQQLLKQGADSILVANRTHERAVRLAKRFLAATLFNLKTSIERLLRWISSSLLPAHKSTYSVQSMAGSSCKCVGTGRCSLSTLQCRVMLILN